MYDSSLADFVRLARVFQWQCFLLLVAFVYDFVQPNYKVQIKDCAASPAKIPVEVYLW